MKRAQEIIDKHLSNEDIDDFMNLKILSAMQEYAIAMCEEQKRQDVNSCRDRGIYFDPSIILKTKNVAE